MVVMFMAALLAGALLWALAMPLAAQTGGGLRWRAMDERMSVRLRLRDPFGLEGSSSRLRDLDYILVGESDESSTSAQLSVSWALGGGGERRGRGRGRR